MTTRQEYEEYCKKAGNAAIGLSHVLNDYELNTKEGVFLLSHYLCIAAIKDNLSKKQLLEHVDKMYGFAQKAPF